MNRLLNGVRATALVLFAIVFVSTAMPLQNAAFSDDAGAAAQPPDSKTPFATDPVVLYDSDAQFKIDQAEEEKERQEEAAVTTDAPSNVVFVGDAEGRPDGSVVDEGDAADESESADLNFELADDESSFDILDQVEPYDEGQKTCDVLIDMRHAHDFSDYPLTLDDRYYHRIYSFHRAFSYLKSQGVRVEKYESDEPLSPQVLSRCKTLFLNLPSGDKAPFFVSEIIAIRDFVEAGGSLFLIVDHTNCYFHQSRLHPLLHELDVEPQFYCVCDADQSLGSSGVGWIYIDTFDAHPITQGLRQIAFQTGGGVDPRFAVAWSGPSSWQDAAGIPIYGEADVGFFGNFIRDQNEPIGPSGVLLAKNQKEGKIVVVGDQNLFSPFFLQYLDVYRLWINAFAWTLDRPELADVSKYVEYARQGRVLICWEELMRGADRFGDPDPSGYYHLYSTLCRYYNAFCVAHDDPELDSEVLVVLHGGETYSQEGFDYAYKRLKEGKTLVVVDPQDDVFDNEKTELSRLLQELQNKDDIANDRSVSAGRSPVKKYVEPITLSNGGRLVLVRGRDSFNNSSVPKPEERLLFVQMENLKVLLHEIDSSFESRDQPAPENEESEESEKTEVRADQEGEEKSALSE